MLISADKCGIIKEGCDMLCGPHVPRQVIIEEHRRLKGRVLEFAESSAASSSGLNSTILSESYNILKTAQRLINVQGFNITNTSFEDVFHNHSLPCRLEELPKELLPKGVSSVAFDVGHNPDALAKTIKAYIQRHNGAAPVVIYGCKERKDYQSCLDQILSLSTKVFAVQARDTKGVVQAETIRSSGQAHGQTIGLIAEGRIAPTIAEVIKQVQAEEIKETHILVIGSFTLMREARTHFGLHCPID